MHEASGGRQVKMKTSNFKVGDWVEVRSKEEILKTLDSNGQLDGMPFMPEMLAFCGRSSRFIRERTRLAIPCFRYEHAGSRGQSISKHAAMAARTADAKPDA